MKNEEVRRLSLKAVVHPALTILSLFIYPHFIPNLHVFFGPIIVPLFRYIDKDTNSSSKRVKI